tara:strand:- start:1071 stop:2114 length:1044 start_codon:yes stop_codon:yes gene_type:complete
MSLGGSKPAVTNNITSNDMPEEYKPYFRNMMTKAEAMSNQPYQTYGGQRIADTNADVLASREMARQIALGGQPGTQEAMDMTRNAAAGVDQYSAADPYQFSQYDYADPEMFSADNIQSYMSPYMQSVVDIEKRKAGQEYGQANQKRASDAVFSGAFGGSRSGVQQAMAENDYLTRSGDIQSKGLQSAFESAANLFEKDRAAKYQTDAARAAELNRVQAGQSGENLSRDKLGMEGLTFKSQQAQQLADLEERARAGDVQAAALLENVGKSGMAEDQARYDMAYQDFLTQRDYPRQQLSDYSAILRGLPLAAVGTSNSTTTGTAAQPSGIQQLLGAGASALGLYKGLVP